MSGDGGGELIHMDKGIHAYDRYTRTCKHTGIKTRALGGMVARMYRGWDTHDINSFAQQQQRAKMDIVLLRY